MVGEPQGVTGDTVVCSGPPGAPHPPRRLDLPPDAVVRCPVCGLTYQGRHDPPHVHPASWPKTDWPGNGKT